MNGHARRVRPWVFFATTYLFSWAVWVPLVLVHQGVLPDVVPPAALTPLALPGVLVPAVAATALTARVGGRRALRRLWGRLAVWRVGWWWVPALLLQPALLLITLTALDLWGRGGEVAAAAGVGVSAVLVQVVLLVVAATGEEVGWRGLALPELQRTGSPIRASTVLGLATATWHLPYWVLQGVVDDYGWGYVAIDYVFVLALTVQLTWLVNHTGGSVLVAVAFHVVFNTVNVALVPVTSSTIAFAVLTLLECLVALAVLRFLAPSGAAHRVTDR